MSRLLVSGYTGGDAAADSLFSVLYDTSSGTLTLEGGYRCGANASFFTLDPSGKFGVAANETEVGALTSFRLEPPFSVINTVSCAGNGPCYVSLHPCGKYVLAANYHDVPEPVKGSTSVVRFADGEGSLSGTVQLVSHEGGGPVTSRQTGPHMHCVLPHPHLPHLVYGVDLGSDAVYQYVMDVSTGLLRPHAGGAKVSFPPGSGPRHIAFSHCGTLAFVTGEMDNNMYVLSVDTTSLTGGVGLMRIIQVLSLLPSEYDASGGAYGGDVYAADVHVHPHAPYVITSVRGYDALVVFKLDVSNKAAPLTLTKHVASGGLTPRNFTISADGKLLAAVHQHSKSLVLFNVDIDGSGDLSLTAWPTTLSIPIPPVCVRFL